MAAHAPASVTVPAAAASADAVPPADPRAGNAGPASATDSGSCPPPGRLRRLRALLPLCVALLPALLGAVFQAAGPRPAASAVKPFRSPLSFHQHMVNLGEVDPLPVHRGRFTFTNTSDQPIELRKLETSCGCLHQELKQRVFTPGESGQFFLRIQTANQTPGPKNYLCNALYGPPDRPEETHQTELTFRMVLPEASVTLEPRAMEISHPDGGAGTYTATVTDLRLARLTVNEATCSLPFVTVEVVQAPASERESGTVAELRVRVSEVPPGLHKSVIRIATNDPVFPDLRLPVRLRGPVPKPAGPVIQEAFDLDHDTPQSTK